MASQQELDTLRDSLVNRGLGNSGLTSQIIQRANLPSLQANVAESQATLANSLATRVKSSQIGAIQNYSNVRSNSLAGGINSGNATSFNNDSPTAVLVPSVRGQQVIGGNNDTSQVFGITSSIGGHGQRNTSKFNSIGDVIGEVKRLRDQGVQVILPGVQDLDNVTADALIKAGVIRVGDVQAQQTILGRGRKGIISQINALKSLPGPGETIAQEGQRNAARDIAKYNALQAMGGKIKSSNILNVPTI